MTSTAASDQLATSLLDLLLNTTHTNSSSSSLPENAVDADSANVMGLAILLCTLAMAMGAACIALKKARSKYRDYIMGSSETQPTASVVVSEYPAFPFVIADAEDELLDVAAHGREDDACSEKSTAEV